MKKKLIDLTLEEYKKWHNDKCHELCEDCAFKSIYCDPYFHDVWINHKDEYPNEFLNQEIELGETHLETLKLLIKSASLNGNLSYYSRVLDLIDIVKEYDEKHTQIKDIADFYGIDQLDILQEECAELIQAISKYKRYKDENKVKEEIADVMIMINQVMYLLGISLEEVLEIEDCKIARQRERMNR